jgi:hypothetical protein
VFSRLMLGRFLRQQSDHYSVGTPKKGTCATVLSGHEMYRVTLKKKASEAWCFCLLQQKRFRQRRYARKGGPETKLGADRLLRHQEGSVVKIACPTTVRRQRLERVVGDPRKSGPDDNHHRNGKSWWELSELM